MHRSTALALLLTALTVACGDDEKSDDELSCGDGTVEVDGECVSDDSDVDGDDGGDEGGDDGGDDGCDDGGDDGGDGGGDGGGDDGGGGGEDCLTCSEALQFVPGTPCDDAMLLLRAIVDCMCESGGACAEACAETTECGGSEPMNEWCSSCMTDPSPGSGCGEAVMECMDDQP